MENGAFALFLVVTDVRQVLGAGVNLPVALMYSPSGHPIVSIVSSFSVKQNTFLLNNLLGV